VAGTILAGSSDRIFDTLYGSIYRAFKKRRSVVLDKVQSQVGLMELPWFKPLDDHKRSDSTDMYTKAKGTANLTTLEDVVSIGLRYWPETTFPNKFVGILKELSDGKADFPFVMEIASDIFFGEFSNAFLRSARIAAALMEGTLYERYYEVSYQQVSALNNTSQYDQLCNSAVSELDEKVYFVIRHGMIIERSMIITTHNLALVFDKLDMKTKLTPILPQLARNTFNFILKETGNLTHMEWKNRLQCIKNAAYAWRQMIFYLSFMSEESGKEFFSRAFKRVQNLESSFQNRITRPLEYLNYVWGVQHGKDDKEKVPEKCIFLGWTSGSHFLMPQKTDTAVSKKQRNQKN